MARLRNAETEANSGDPLVDSFVDFLVRIGATDVESRRVLTAYGSGDRVAIGNAIEAWNRSRAQTREVDS